ncbi:MAG: hypothetical protein KGO02_26075 [Alphaproteobacteria bacterium]|nr:hypothetical protein [Alphaproteobacteria bacterium]
MRRVMVAAVAGVLAAVAGIAVAETMSASDRNDYDAPGRHQFYVWCANGKNYAASEQGANAEAAQMKLYDALKAEGRVACWPVWQGRLAGS